MGISGYNLPDAAAFIYALNLTECVISDETTHHLANVLRIKSGQRIILSDGLGNWRLCVADTNTKNSFRFVDQEDIVKSELTPMAVAVGFALTKPTASETTVQKLAELGVNNIFPFIAQRTPFKVDDNLKGKLLRRFNKIAASAGEQSRNPFLPIVHEIQSFKNLAESYLGKAALVQPGYASMNQDALSSVEIILIGPEGGFTLEELESVQTKFSLANSILRSETAATAVGVLLNYLDS